MESSNKGLFRVSVIFSHLKGPHNFIYNYWWARPTLKVEDEGGIEKKTIIISLAWYRNLPLLESPGRWDVIQVAHHCCQHRKY